MTIICGPKGSARLRRVSDERCLPHNKRNVWSRCPELAGSSPCGFFADWCGPCRMLAPALDRLAAEFSGKARIVEVHVDREPALASQFNVGFFPNLTFIVDGEIVGQSAGAPPEAALRPALNQLISQAA